MKPTNREEELYYSNLADKDHEEKLKRVGRAEIVDKQLNLSEHIWKDDCSCGCEHINTFFVKEFIKRLKEDIINLDMYEGLISESEREAVFKIIDKRTGEKLI